MYPQDDYYLTYNDAGLVTQAEWKQDPDNPGHTLNFYRRYQYAYDSQSRLTEIKAYKVVLSKVLLEYEVRFTYETDKNPISGIRRNYLEDGTLFLEFTETYFYRQDNVVSVTSKTTGNTDSYTRSYQYDDHPNPSYGVIIGGSYSASILSKNNLLESGQVYTYNDQGLPMKKAWSKSDGNGEIQYEYETY